MLDGSIQIFNKPRKSNATIEAVCAIAIQDGIEPYCMDWIVSIGGSQLLFNYENMGH